MGEVILTLYDFERGSFLSAPLDYARQIVEKCNVFISSKSRFCEDLNLAHLAHDFSNKSDAEIFCKTIGELETIAVRIKIVRGRDFHPKPHITKADWKPWACLSAVEAGK